LGKYQKTTSSLKSIRAVPEVAPAQP